MTLLDWSMLTVIALSVVLAAGQGFFFEVFSLSGTILGYLLAMWEYPRVAAWFLPYVKAQQYANIAGFLTIFFSIIILAGIEVDADRNSLHYFHIVSGRVFGWQKAEARSARSTDCLNLAPVFLAEGVDSEPDPLPWAHAAELRFFEIRGDPDIV